MKVRIAVIEGADAGRSFDFNRRDRFLVGRSPKANLCVANDPFFSRHHFMVDVNPPNVLLQDPGSMNGTFVNASRTRVANALLRHGDVIWGGRSKLRIEVDRALDAEDIALAETHLPKAAPDGLGLDDLLGPAPSAAAAGPDALVDVRCMRCGSKASEEEPRHRAESVAFFCDSCRTALRDEPILLPDYQIVKKLGCGGMGCVYLVLHTQLKVKRAIKQILPEAAVSLKQRAMFVREATEQAQLRHPRIVDVIDFREAKPGIFCMVMEFIEGTTAEALLEETNNTGLEPRLAVEIVSQALEGLGHAHARGVVHRDVKDANILVSRDPTGGVSVKLADFGLAKSYERSGSSGFTRSGDLAGTVPYMSPEQIRDLRNVKPPADLYSMGATLYMLLSGQFPHDYPNDSSRSPFLVILEDPIVPLRARNPRVPPKLAEAVEKALEMEPEARFATADEMRRAIRASIGER